MKIIINASYLSSGGGRQVAISFINELRSFPENEYFVFVNTAYLENIDISTFNNNIKFYYFDWRTAQICKTHLRAKYLSKLEHQIQPNYIISVIGPTYWRSDAIQILRFARGLYIYSESPYFKYVSLWSKISLWLHKQVHGYFFRRDGDIIVCQTNDVSERVRKWLNVKNVCTVTNNCSSFFYDFDRKSYKPIIGQNRAGKIRLLCLTEYYRHKNLEIISDVISELELRGVTNIEFILTVSDENYKKLIPERYAKNARTVGEIQPKDCPNIYMECDIAFVPTLLECFSAAYPEAMVMNLPIVTVDLPFARSICNDAAIYYSAIDASDAAIKIIEIINNKSLCHTLIANGLKQLEKFDTPHDRVKKNLEVAYEAYKEKNRTI